MTLCVKPPSNQKKREFSPKWFPGTPLAQPLRMLTRQSLLLLTALTLPATSALANRVARKAKTRKAATMEFAVRSGLGKGVKKRGPVTAIARLSMGKKGPVVTMHHKATKRTARLQLPFGSKHEGRLHAGQYGPKAGWGYFDVSGEIWNNTGLVDGIDFHFDGVDTFSLATPLEAFGNYTVDMVSLSAQFRNGVWQPGILTVEQNSIQGDVEKSKERALIPLRAKGYHGEQRKLTRGSVNLLNVPGLPHVRDNYKAALPDAPAVGFNLSRTLAVPVGQSRLLRGNMQLELGIYNAKE